MPLSMIGEGETATITRVGGKEETRRFLENLGFVVGAIVTVVSKTGGNVIVNIKESRVAIGNGYKDYGVAFIQHLKKVWYRLNC